MSMHDVDPYRPRVSLGTAIKSRRGRLDTAIEGWGWVLLIGLVMGTMTLSLLVPHAMIIVTLAGIKVAIAWIGWAVRAGRLAFGQEGEYEIPRHVLNHYTRAIEHWHTPGVTTALGEVAGGLWLAGLLGAIASLLAFAWYQYHANRMSETTIERGCRLVSPRQLTWEILNVQASDWARWLAKIEGNGQAHALLRRGATAWLAKYPVSLPQTCGLHVCGVPFPGSNVHLLAAGMSGSGKTTTMLRLIQQARETSIRLIIYDVKGDYTKAFYRPERDILISGADNRCFHWSMFADIRELTDLDLIASAWIPDQQGAQTDSFFWQAARQVFAAMLEFLKRRYGTNATYAHLLAMLNADRETLCATLSLYPETIGAVSAHLGSEKQAAGILATLKNYVSTLRYIQDLPATVSLRDYVRNGTGDIFIANHPDREEALKPLNTAAISVVLTEMVSLPETEHGAPARLIAVLDEVSSLNKMPVLIKAMREVRSRGCGIWVGTQDFGGLRQTYGHDTIVSFVNGFSMLLVQRVAEAESQKYLEQGLGEQDVREYEENETIGEETSERLSMSRKLVKRAAVMGSEIGNLKTHEMFVKVMGYNLTKVTNTPITIHGTEPAFVPRAGLGAIPTDSAAAATPTLVSGGATPSEEGSAGESQEEMQAETVSAIPGTPHPPSTNPPPQGASNGVAVHAARSASPHVSGRRVAPLEQVLGRSRQKGTE